MGDGQQDDALVEMVTRIDERTAQMYKAIFGNGRPGLIENVAVLQSEMADVQKRAPSSNEKRAGWTAIGVAVIAGAFGLASAILHG